MLIIESRHTDYSALPAGVRNLLILRSELTNLAVFVIVDGEDSLDAIEQVIGFPIDPDFPPWEWVINHGDVFEAPIITDDDGHATVLIVPDDHTIDDRLSKALRDHAEASPIIGHARQ